jgi:hypothetical protein
MSVLLGTDPTKAYKQIDRIEKALQRMAAKHKSTSVAPAPVKVGSGNASAKYTADLVEQTSLAVEHCTKLISYDLGNQTPQWSSWLRANWNHVQGKSPSLGITPSPKRNKGQFRDFVQPIIGNVDLDGTQAQYFYNTVSYAEDVAMGNYPGVDDSIPLDWYFQIEQHHASGGYMRTAVEYARRTFRR